MNVPDLISSLVQFREQVYGSFSHRQDSLMVLLDALCTNERDGSVVELSLNPLFSRGYSALYTAIDALSEWVLPLSCRGEFIRITYQLSLCVAWPHNGNSVSS